MPELIERGYIYIAQPPLYRVQKGKQKQYLKDDDALNNLLLQNILDDISWHVDDSAPEISKAHIEKVVNLFTDCEKRITRLSSRLPKVFLTALTQLPPFEATEQWAKLCQQTSSSLKTSLDDFDFTANIEDSSLSIKVHHRSGQVDENNIKDEFFMGQDYKILSEFSNLSQDMLTDQSFITHQNKRYQFSSMQSLIEWLMQKARGGLSIQRFKGLGEMNADQLWETTMNPETRVMLKVKVQDAIQADEMFSTLMGDQVEPRKLFIETHAQYAENIDT